jgi:hypothetical protein
LKPGSWCGSLGWAASCIARWTILGGWDGRRGSTGGCRRDHRGYGAGCRRQDRRRDAERRPDVFCGVPGRPGPTRLPGHMNVELCLPGAGRGIGWSMGRYSCPVCSADVPPVSLGRISDGRITGPSAQGLLIERKKCPACGESLERTPLDRWHTRGSLASARPEIAATERR